MDKYKIAFSDCFVVADSNSLSPLERGQGVCEITLLPSLYKPNGLNTIRRSYPIKSNNKLPQDKHMLCHTAKKSGKIYGLTF